MNTITQIRKADLYVGTEKAAVLLDKSDSWVKKNRSKFPFVFRRKNGGRLLEYEISSVLEVWNKLQLMRKATKT